MATKQNPEELAAKRQSAAYITTMNRLGRTDPDMDPKEADRICLDANDLAVYGFDAKKDRHGNYIEQGIGSKGHETSNHFSSILRWQGRAEYDKAVAEIYERDPKRHAMLRLPKPEKAEKVK